MTAFGILGIGAGTILLAPSAQADEPRRERLSEREDYSPRRQQYLEEGGRETTRQQREARSEERDAARQAAREERRQERAAAQPAPSATTLPAPAASGNTGSDSGLASAPAPEAPRKLIYNKPANPSASSVWGR